MKKSELKQLVKEILLETKGYSKYYPGGKTPGLTSKTLNQILLNIAKSEEPYEGDPDKGNKVLDTANQDNVDKILRGEDPHVSRMQELAGVKNEGTVNNPNKIPSKIITDEGDYKEIELIDTGWDFSISEDKDYAYSTFDNDEESLIQLEEFKQYLQSKNILNKTKISFDDEDETITVQIPLEYIEY